jgi:hypothetical protein
MAGRLSPALAVVMILASIGAPVCLGQMRGSGLGVGHFSTGRAGGFGRYSFGHRGFAYPRGYYLDGFPYFYDDYPYAQSVPEAGSQVIVLQQPAAEVDAPAQARVSPLLIELEGDRYVRYGGVSSASERQPVGTRPKAQLDSAKTSSTHSTNAARSTISQPSAEPAEPSPTQLAPTVLIFRDGHREEVPDYAIVGRVLYAHGVDDGEPGYGVKNIQLSALDIPATMKANRENGISFMLPSGPNEVVTRP